MPSSETTFLNLLPETVLVLWATLIMVGGAFVRARVGWPVVAVIATLLAASALVWSGNADIGAYERTEASGPLLLDALGATMRWLGVAIGLLLVLVLARDAMQGQTSEMLGMLLLVVGGMMLTCWAGTTILLFLGLELISIPTYVLLFVGRKDDASAEATTKYFFLSILSSTFFLLGLSLLFGLTGTTQLSGMSAAMVGAPIASPRLLLLATMFVFAGLGFKIAAVPFHFYAPDVYQATTNGNAAILAVVPKLAGLVALVRILVALSSGGPMLFATQLTLVLSILTMTLGNVCALWQTNVRRLLAYSSIAHAGYMLMGVAVGLSAAAADARIAYGGYAAALFYLVVYSFASLGTFAVLCEIESGGPATNTLDGLSGLARRRPGMAAALAVFMFSLAGLPPLFGFWGKLTLFTSAVSVATDTAAAGSLANWFVILLVVAVLNAAVAAAYYLRVIGVVYFGDEGPRPDEQNEPAGPAALAAMVCAAVVVLGGFVPGTSAEHFRGVGRSLLDQPVVTTAADAAEALLPPEIAGIE